MENAKRDKETFLHRAKTHFLEFLRDKEALHRAITHILKFLTGLAVFVPLMLAVIQYHQAVRQDLDKNFRAIIENLSLPDKEKRLAAASSIGTFIKKGSKHYTEALDILVNRLSIEIDYDVLNAIRGSLEKIENKDLKDVIDKLLSVERNLFIQEYALKTWSLSARAAFEDVEDRFVKEETLFEQSKSEIHREKLDNLKAEMNTRWNRYINREKDYTELSMHKQVAYDFISIFLRVTRSHPLKGLLFFRNSLNSAVLIGINLSHSKFDRCALSNSVIYEVKFDGSTIINTDFALSDFTNSSFVNCKIERSLFDQANLKNVDFSRSRFSEVFFADTDLTRARFNHAKGLKPIYFYKAKNLDKAVFDPAFEKELSKELVRITDDIFKDYVNKSELDEERKETFHETLDKVLYNKPPSPK